ncbi:MAG: sulfatase-like hydrolase/transferase, partial [Acidobacteriaceae bacterium]|nr:sulfatase-like hydrolase/transferase [Acidobacteriaceae bacterium]
MELNTTPTRRACLTRLAAALSATQCAWSGQGANDRPKNVLLIMSDQHKRDCLGAAGDPVAHTPNLDELARTSVRFTDAYCTNP